VIKRIAAFMTMGTAVAMLAVTASLAGNVLFEDKFTVMDSGWGLPSQSALVKDGKFILSPDVNQGISRINQSAFLPDDMDVSVTMNYQKVGADQYASGPVFWVNNDTEYYYFVVSPSGLFAVLRYVAGGRVLVPVAWQASDAVKKGEGSDNVLRAVTKGTQGTVYINGQQVGTFTGQPPAGGSQIGLRASSGVNGVNVVAFSNLTVVQP